MYVCMYVECTVVFLLFKKKSKSCLNDNNNFDK